MVSNFPNIMCDLTSLHSAHRGRLSNFVRAGKLVSWKNLEAGISKKNLTAAKLDTERNLTAGQT